MIQAGLGNPPGNPLKVHFPLSYPIFIDQLSGRCLNILGEFVRYIPYNSIILRDFGRPTRALNGGTGRSRKPPATTLELHFPLSYRIFIDQFCGRCLNILVEFVRYILYNSIFLRDFGKPNRALNCEYRPLSDAARKYIGATFPLSYPIFIDQFSGRCLNILAEFVRYIRYNTIILRDFGNSTRALNAS